MGRESFGVVEFDLGPLLQGQTGIAKLKSAYGQISPWAFPSRLSDVRMALVSFLLVDTICIGSPMR